MMTATVKNEIFAAAQAKADAGQKAYERGDWALGDAFMQQAADRYRACGYKRLAQLCLGRKGR